MSPTEACQRYITTHFSLTHLCVFIERARQLTFSIQGSNCKCVTVNTVYKRGTYVQIPQPGKPPWQAEFLSDTTGYDEQGVGLRRIPHSGLSSFSTSSCSVFSATSILRHTNNRSYPRKNTHSTVILTSTPRPVAPPWIVSFRGGNTDRPDMTVRLSPAPTCVVRPTVSSRGASLLFDRRQIQWKRQHLHDTVGGDHRRRGSLYSLKYPKNKPSYFVFSSCAATAVNVACRLKELFIVSPLSVATELRQHTPPTPPAVDTTLKGTLLQSPLLPVLLLLLLLFRIVQLLEIEQWSE